jgi:hypothetical protein
MQKAWRSVSSGLMVAGALLAALPALAVPPSRIRVYYELSYNGVVMAEGNETLEHDGRAYRIESEARGKGFYALLQRGAVKRTSRGQINANGTGLRPVEFRDQRGDRTPEFARFDWNSRVVTHERGGKQHTSPITDGMLDRVSFMWNFAFAQPKAEINTQVADGRGTTQFRYAVAGSEVIKTPAGEIESLHLVKQRDSGDARQTELWLDVKRSYVPVRLLVIEKDGTRVDQVVTRFEP